MKLIILWGLLSSIIFANSNTAMQFSGVSSTYKEKEINVKRLINPKCKKVGITPNNIFGGNLSNKDISFECKKSFITSLGTVQPIKIDSQIDTVGELEVLKFLELLEFEPHLYALIDVRTSQWYENMTIPNAINIPYTEIEEDEDFPNDSIRLFKLLNIIKDKNENLDFSNAKKIVVFCNASWCVQSVLAIKSLIKIGYPKNKILWFRGGLEDWAGLGFTTVKP